MGWWLALAPGGRGKGPAVQSSLGDECAGPNPTAEIHYSLIEEFTKEQYSLIK